jgi:hypothetical protein
LIISKDLAHVLGGDCTASSEYGSGSTFTFTMTVEKDQEANLKIAPLKSNMSCFILCQPGPWWDMLEQK